MVLWTIPTSLWRTWTAALVGGTHAGQLPVTTTEKVVDTSATRFAVTW